MKRFEIRVDPLTQEVYYATRLTGYPLMNDPLLNKGSAFTAVERVEFGITGLVADAIGTLEEQLERAYENYLRKTTDLERYITLIGLLDRNETLFYALLTRHITEMLPIVYTPTVGQACLNLSHIIRRYRGLYVSRNNIENIETMLRNTGLPEVSLIVITDGERILGLGDLGVDGMAIPIGKTTLYVAAGGIHPASTLPVCLDVGTNNERLLNDHLYIGIRKPRLTGDAYYAVIERFVQGVKRVYPRALIQWEDFGKSNAFNILDRYSNRILSFNDDIQGTGATAAAAIMTAAKISGRKVSQEKIAILGFGQAGSGVANALVTLMNVEENTPIEIARRNIYAIDINGLLIEGMEVEPHQINFVHPKSEISQWSYSGDSPKLFDVIKNANITILIGLAAQPNVFNEEIISMVAQHTPSPIILALSNPTSKCETKPEIVEKASNGRALMAFGSPFEPYQSIDGKKKWVSQCNNLYIFPGVGLGSIVCQASKITHRMFHAASKALSALTTQEQREQGLLLPPLENIRNVSYEVAFAVAKQAREEGLGINVTDEHLSKLIKQAMWIPKYYPLRLDRSEW
ncbi:MAG: NAD-dependent malic enzyme [bacterium]|nr:NAD-dependent malic enzyme [bacterium]